MPLLPLQNVTKKEENEINTTWAETKGSYTLSLQLMVLLGWSGNETIAAGIWRGEYTGKGVKVWGSFLSLGTGKPEQPYITDPAPDAG